QRDALAAAPGTTAAVVARRQAARGHASAWLALPRPQPNRSGLFAATASRGPGGRRGRRHPQARQPAHAASQLRHPPARTGYVDIRVIQVLLGHSKLETTAL